jgi:hypothetical protein
LGSRQGSVCVGESAQLRELLGIDLRARTFRGDLLRFDQVALRFELAAEVGHDLSVSLGDIDALEGVAAAIEQLRSRCDRSTTREG